MFSTDDRDTKKCKSDLSFLSLIFHCGGQFLSKSFRLRTPSMVLPTVKWNEISYIYVIFKLKQLIDSAIENVIGSEIQKTYLLTFFIHSGLPFPAKLFPWKFPNDGLDDTRTQYCPRSLTCKHNHFPLSE